jgi:hypothetical protein
MDEEVENHAEDPIEGQFDGEQSLERLVLVFLSADSTPVAVVEGSKFPAPAVGDVVTFGEGEYILRLPDKEFRDTVTESGREYEVIERRFNFANQEMDFQDMKIGPLTRGTSGRGLTTTIFYEVCELSD